MISVKKGSPRPCIKCSVPLTDQNWAPYNKNNGTYICILCRKKKEKLRYLIDLDYGKKQRNRYRMRRSAVIFQYGNKCAQCSEDDYTRLTIDHINGGRSAHRKIMTTNIIDYLYNNIVNKDGYQVLCYNCNCSKDVIYKDKYALRDKKKVMEAYGGYCAECKEDRIERLTIDHKNNDGAAQRKKWGCATGARMYRWLIKQSYPQDLGLQILCFNCNCSKIAISKYEPEELG